MVKYSVLLVLPLLVCAQPDVGQISAKLLEVKQLVLPGRKPTVIFHQEKVSSTLEAVLVRYLNESTDPVFITSSWKIFKRLYKSTFNSILFFDMLNANVREALVGLPFNRCIVVSNVQTLIKILNEPMNINGIYVIYDIKEFQIYHFNRYTKAMNKFDNLHHDPLIAATVNLFGMKFSTVKEYPVNLIFMDFILSHLNGTLDFSEHVEIFMMNLQFLQGVVYENEYNSLYLHRNEKVLVFVPRLNNHVPSIFVLTDPLDIPSWILILGVILSISLLRTYFAGINTIPKVLKNIEQVLSIFTVGTRLKFHRELERLLFGVFLLLTVVLINAYQSMIISYLLSPRFYPELDTMQLINDSCCWENYRTAYAYKFQRLAKCRNNTGYVSPESKLSQIISKSYNNSYCMIFDEWLRKLMSEYTTLAIASGLFRWSKQIINEWPSMAYILGDSVAIERILNLARVYFAEGALYRKKETEPNNLWSSNLEATIKPTTVGELALVWMIYATGISSSVLICILEKMHSIYK